MRYIVRQALFVVALVGAFFVVPPTLYPMARANATLADFSNGSSLANFRDTYGNVHIVVVDAAYAPRDRVIPVVYDDVTPSWASARLDDVSPRIAEERHFVSAALVLVALAALAVSSSAAASSALTSRVHQS